MSECITLPAQSRTPLNTALHGPVWLSGGTDEVWGLKEEKEQSVTDENTLREWGRGGAD